MSRRRSLLVLAGFSVLQIILFAGSSMAALDRACLPWCYGDPTLYRWMFAWTAHAITHAENPFVTTLIGAPSGAPLYWVTSILTPALAAMPVTLLLGSQASYNLAMLLAGALSGWAVYLLCLEVCERHGPSVIGGLLFLISPYMIAESMHLNLYLVAPVPLFARLLIRFGRGRVRLARFSLAGGLLLLAEFFTSTETFASMALFTVIGTGLYVASDRHVRAERLRWLCTGLAGAYAVAAVVTMPFLLAALPSRPEFVAFPLVDRSATLADVLIPPVTTVVGSGRDMAALRSSVGMGARTFHEASSNSFLPLPVIFLVWKGLRDRARYPRALLWFTIATILLAFGPMIQITGAWSIPGPYALLSPLPVLDMMFPKRFSLYSWLAISLFVSLWMTGRVDPSDPRPPWAVVRWLAVGMVLLWPVVPGLSPNMRTPSEVTSIQRVSANPELFRSQRYRWFIRQDEIVAIPPRLLGEEIDWQTDAMFGFRLTEGHLGPYTPWSPPALKHKYASGPVTSSELTTLREFGARIWDLGDLRRFLAERQADWVALRTGERGHLRALLQEGSWLPPISFGGVDLYRVSGWDHEPPAPLSPQAAEALRRGLASSREGMLTEAAGWFREVLADSPMDPTAHLELARIYLAYGDEVFAEAHLRAVLVAQPSAAVPMLELARLWASQDRTTYAERAYMLAYLADPSVLNPEELAEVEARAGL